MQEEQGRAGGIGLGGLPGYGFEDSAMTLHTQLVGTAGSNQ